jgi:hypothetical protein
MADPLRWIAGCRSRPKNRDFSENARKSERRSAETRKESAVHPAIRHPG